MTAKTDAERQAARRERMKKQGASEVRGIFLRDDLHAPLKEYAKRLAAKTAKDKK